MSEGDFLNYSSCSSAAAQLLFSIPSQQPDPPKHSTPKSGEDVGRPVFDESAIYQIDFDRKSSTSSAVSHRINNAPILSEREQVNNFLENELQKRRTTAALNAGIKEQSLDSLNKRIVRDDLPCSSSRDSATTADLMAAYRKMPKFEIPRNSRPLSSASDTDMASSSRPSKLAFERGKDKLNFYCVPIGEALVLRLRVWNVDSMQMRLKCGISDEKGREHPNFTIFEVTAPIMEPGGQCEIAVQYKPTKVERNFAHLVVERTNCEYFKKTFQLIGDGGCADVGLAASNYTDGVAKKATSSQAVVIQPNDPNHFWLEFENRGQRPAYVKLVTTNRIGKSIPNEQICINPEQFVLNSDTQNRWKVSVRVSETFDWCGEISPPRFDSIGRQHSKEVVVFGKRPPRESVGTGGGRDSILSSSSSGTASSQQQQPDCAFRIEAHWGEEQQRQRLKCWQWKSKLPALVNGLQFTSTFEGEHPTTIAQRQKISATLTDGEAAEFKNSLRQLTFNVVNVQAKAYFPPWQPDVKHPIIELYRNQSRLLKETIPDEESCGNAATLGLLLTSCPS
uniref:Uncharacterized protein n=1 Tax=Globodera rostochiensis TaxID=31243 RepID=A0A914HZI3_GLORO